MALTGNVLYILSQRYRSPPACPTVGRRSRRYAATSTKPVSSNAGTDARETCAACRVRGDCLNYATEADEFGIWGGLDQHERRSLKRKQRRRMEAAPQAKGNQAEGAA
jgi:predicted RecB family nuclease